MNEYCSNLDNYLLGDLSRAEEAAFTEHLDSCDECREAIGEQQWIDGLLQASAQLDNELPPQRIAAELRAVVTRRESFRKRAIAVSFASAATLLVAATWLLSHPSGNLHEQLAKTIDVPASPPTPQAKFVAGRDTIAVPVESRHPEVTIVRVYSTFRPTDDSAVAAFEPESSNPNNLIDFSNGGSYATH